MERTSTSTLFYNEILDYLARRWSCKVEDIQFRKGKYINSFYEHVIKSELVDGDMEYTIAFINNPKRSKISL